MTSCRHWEPEQGQGAVTGPCNVGAALARTARDGWLLQGHHRVPHQHGPPVTPHSCSGRSGGNRQCHFTVLLQGGYIPDLAELSYPRSSLAQVLGHLHATKPFWAEAALQAAQWWPSKQCKWSEMRGEIYPDIVCLSLCHCLLPKQLSHAHIPQVFWCVNTLWWALALSPRAKQQTFLHAGHHREDMSLLSLNMHFLC